MTCPNRDRVRRALRARGAGVPLGVCLLLAAFAAKAQAPPNMDDLTCYLAGELCGGPGVPAGWAQGDVYAMGQAVAKLRVYANVPSMPAEPEFLVGVCTGFLIDHGGRDDLIITAKHCVDLNFAYALDEGPEPPGGSPGNPDENEPPRNAAPGDAAVSRVEAEFDYEYAPICRCVNDAPLPAACDPLNACDTPETTAMCTPPAVWNIVHWGDADTCDWVVLKAVPNPGPINPGLPGAVMPKIPLGVFAPATSVVQPQHPSGRCKEVHDAASDAVHNACDFRHLVEGQSGSSGSPVLYLKQGVPALMGVHRAVLIAGPNVGKKLAVKGEVVAAGIVMAVAKADAWGQKVPSLSPYALVVLASMLAAAAALILREFARRRSNRT